MQERKNKRLLILLFALAALTALLYWIGLRKEINNVDKEVFRLDDYTNIDKVVLESSPGRVELAFTGARWKINNIYNADPDLIKVLFATLQQAEPKRPVAKSVRDSVNTRLELHGIKVSLFSGAGLLQSFLVGGNATKTQAYFRAEGSDEIFVMTIPGYRVYVSGIFELSALQLREKYAFNFNWRNFQTLEASFPDMPHENFTVGLVKNNMFAIQENTATDTAKLNTFLDNISLLTVNEYLEPGKTTDSLEKATPVMIIKIRDLGNNDYSLKLFREKDSQVYGILDDHQGVVFNRLKAVPILRTRSFFKPD